MVDEEVPDLENAVEEIVEEGDDLPDDDLPDDDDDSDEEGDDLA